MNPIQTVDYIRILPELVLTAFGIIVMMADPLLKPGASRKGLGLVALWRHHLLPLPPPSARLPGQPGPQLRQPRLVRHGARR